ncbi:MAG: hypothetical protein H7Z73_00630 [Candidatus Saccharibacteria bacterium]|nr:hypothetical protein [Moraxellaceae bacterium]
MKKRKQLRLTASVFAVTLLSQAVHAEINQETLGNTLDVLGVIARVATATPKANDPNVSPTAEQRAAIIGEIARGAGNNDDVIKQNIVDAQSPIQSVLEAASCAKDNRVSPRVESQFSNQPNFMSSAKMTPIVIANVCANAVRVGQWQMPSPEILEFTAMFRPEQSEQVNTWKFKIKRQISGNWQLESRENVTSAN